eukprot:3522230-Prymnesium_polylepis.1
MDKASESKREHDQLTLIHHTAHVSWSFAISVRSRIEHLRALRRPLLGSPPRSARTRARAAGTARLARRVVVRGREHGELRLHAL